MVSVVFAFCLYTCILFAQVSSDFVYCKNGSVCPDEDTCCLMTSGEYGCCNMPGATCCSDHTHCCPHGYSCNVTANVCHWGSKVQEWQTKTPAKHAEEIVCKNNSLCPEGSICCRFPSDRYGCCPSGSLVCPGGRYTCPKETTCCKTQTEEMGCCPLNSATCCADGAHCCPYKFQCNLSTMTCFRGTAVIKLQVKLTATPSNVTVSCNNSTACLDIYTCCDSGPSRYGCCPMREAVCCSDHIHCCPQGYHCDVSAGTCNKGSETVAWLTRKPSRSAPNVQKGD